MSCLALPAAALLLALQPAQGSGAELLLVQQQIAALQRHLEARLEALERELEGLRESLGREAAEPLAGPFLASPPASSDSVGVARVPVFAPVLSVDSPARYDIVFLSVYRLEPEGRRLVGRTELGQSPEGVSLPLDRSGALYRVDWSTSDGHSYDLELRDGLSGLVAAFVKVKPLEHSGSFLLVGYAAE